MWLLIWSWVSVSLTETSKKMKISKAQTYYHRNESEVKNWGEDTIILENFWVSKSKLTWLKNVSVIYWNSLLPNKIYATGFIVRDKGRGLGVYFFLMLYVCLILLSYLLQLWCWISETECVLATIPSYCPCHGTRGR